MTASVALITGGARRIGAAIVRALHGAGYDVLIHARAHLTEAEQLAAELNAQRRESSASIRADLTDSEEIQELASAALRWRGRIDLLVNNASAFYATPMGSVTDTQWDDLFAANLRAPFFLSQALAEGLRESGGAIVNITDIHAERPMPGHSVYCMAKAGLLMMTRSLARELAPEVRVNAIAPGAILWPETPEAGANQESILARIPLERTGRPEDIANAVCYLASSSNYVTGQVLAVDGGRSLNM